MESCKQTYCNKDKIFRPWDDKNENVQPAHKKKELVDLSIPTSPWDGIDNYNWSTYLSLQPGSNGIYNEFYTAETFSKNKSTITSSRPKKYKCNQCGAAFSNNGQLKGHIRIHTGERPYKCDNDGCGKSFTRNEELTRHKRIHSGLRPFPCGECGKTFGRKDHLKKHVKTHLPQPQYVATPLYIYPYLYGY